MIKFGKMAKTKVKGLYNLNAIPEPCSGEIEIMRQSEIIAYITWRMVDEKGQFIASVSREYFIGKSKKNLFEEALDNMSKYRIDRKVVFSNLFLVKE